MSGQFIEISNDGYYIRKKRGFLLICQMGQPVSAGLEVPLDRIDGVFVSANGVTFSKSVLTEVAIRGIPLVLSDNNHQPVGTFVSYNGNHLTANMINQQAEMTLPQKKSIWQKIVRSKIKNQGEVLQYLNGANPLLNYPPTVKSGDPTNREAVAAKIYWEQLFGKGFKRNRTEPGINTLLNYGYAILRASMAKHVTSAGLSPSLSVHHRNARNAFRLVDDLIEPFRPLVDVLVYSYLSEQNDELTPRFKLAAVKLWSDPLFTGLDIGRSGQMILRNSVHAFCRKMKYPKEAYSPCPISLIGEMFRGGLRELFSDG